LKFFIYKLHISIFIFKNDINRRLSIPLLVRKMMQKKRFQKTRAGYPSYDHANPFAVFVGRI